MPRDPQEATVETLKRRARALKALGVSDIIEQSPCEEQARAACEEAAAILDDAAEVCALVVQERRVTPRPQVDGGQVYA